MSAGKAVIISYVLMVLITLPLHYALAMQYGWYAAWLLANIGTTLALYIAMPTYRRLFYQAITHLWRL